MAKHTLKILRCEQRKIFKVVWPFYNIMHERVKYFYAYVIFLGYERFQELFKNLRFSRNYANFL